MIMEIREFGHQRHENGMHDTFVGSAEYSMPRLMTMQQTAQYLQLSMSSIKKMSANKVIPVYKPTNGRVYFKEQDVLAYVESGRKSSIGEIRSETLQALSSSTRRRGRMQKFAA